MDATTEATSHPSASPPKASAARDISGSVISVAQPDLELQSRLSSERRAKSKSSPLAKVILSAFFVMLLLSMIGAAGYHCFFTSSVKASKILSSLNGPTGDCCVSSRTTGSTLSGSSVKAAAVPSSIKGAQSLLSRHPRSLAATILAVVLAIALVATVVVLVKTLNAPPQVIEKNDTGTPNPTHSDPEVSSMTPLAKGIIAVAAVLFVAAAAGFGFAYKTRRSAAQAQAKALDKQNRLQAEHIKVRKQLAQVYNDKAVLLADADDKYNLVVEQRKELQERAARRMKMLQNLDDHVMNSDNYLRMGLRISELFNELHKMALPHYNSDEDTWKTINAEVNAGPAPNHNFGLQSMTDVFNGPEYMFHINMLEAGYTPATYFAHMLRHRRSIDYPILENGFLLLVVDADDNYLEADAEVPAGAKFIAVGLDSLYQADVGTLKYIMSKFIEYEAEFDRLYAEEGGIPLPNRLVHEVPDDTTSNSGTSNSNTSNGGDSQSVHEEEGDDDDDEEEVDE